MLVLLSFLACNPEKGIDDELASGGAEAGHDATLASAPPPPPGAKPLVTRVDRGTSVAKPLPVSTAKLPAGALVRRDCYGGGMDDHASARGIGSSGGGMGSAGPGQPSYKPSPSPARPPAMRPSAPEAASAPADAGRARREASKGDAAPAAEPPASPSLTIIRGNKTIEESVGSAPPPPPAAVPPMQEDEKKAETADRDLAVADEEAPERRVSRDWGAKVYLSNDDSMSLASAQRLLWAVDQGRRFSPGEVRPHELLNYFSFDTAPVEGAELFSALGSAEVEGDTLSVALAVQGAKPARQPLDLSLVIDRSGSMQAEGRMAYVRRGLTKMVDQLQPGDRVDLVLFDSDVCTPLQNFVVGRDDASILRSEIARMQPRGSTDLDGGLREGFRVQTSRDAGDVHGRNRRILLLTDAMLNTGNVNQDLVSEVGKRFEADGIRVTGVGVGREFNDTMLNKLTEKGKGAYVYLGSEAVVDRVFGASFDSLVQTIAHDVQFSIDLPDSLAMEKFYGEESSTNPEDVQPIHYYAGTSQLFLQDLKIKDGRVNPRDPVVFEIAYRDARTGEPQTQTFHTTVGALLDGDTHNLKKAQALMAWTDLLATRAMGDLSCGSLGTYRSAASQVTGDAEIAYVSSLTGKLCGVDMSQTVAATGVRYKVKVDADLPIPEVRLACGGQTWKDALSGSDTVATFENAQPGPCELVLDGNVPMRASVEVPSTGGDVRCLVRGGRLSCD